MTSAKKILYVDLDNTLVDLPSGIARLSAEAREKYAGNLDDAPGIFSLMDPLPGALDAYRELAGHFDTYILSTAPWKNASAWHDKVLWVQEHLGFDEGTPAWKRLILSHHKHLNRGDFLVDDRRHNGAAKFEGEWMPFGGGEKFPTWDSVTDYLIPIAQRWQLNVAIDLAWDAHAGQTDKVGVDYIQHPLEVMRRVTTHEEKTVAVLHDVVEDTAVTLHQLRAMLFSPEIVEAVDALTKRPGEPLAESMARVLASPLAVTVKKADISHNTDPVRQAGLVPAERARLTLKYEESARLLGTTLGEILAEHAPARAEGARACVTVKSS